MSRSRRVRVAVIDSGVNAGHPHIAGVAGGVSVNAAGEVEDGSFADVLGHGTAVMAAIQEKAPEAEYFAVRVFHDSLRTSTRCLARAMEWSIAQGMDVVNLSLGTRNPNHAALFAPLVERARVGGVALVSAYEADGEKHYPGSMEGVFGVGLDSECERALYGVENGVFMASGYPRPAPGIPLARNLQGISFAVANMSGFIARARRGLGKCDLETLRREVAGLAAKDRKIRSNSLTNLC